MYLSKHFEQNDQATLHNLVRAHPLGAWVVYSDGELVANHIPFLLDATRGEHGTLLAHVARANPIWRSIGSGADSLVIFRGPDAYISPSWYPSKRDDGKVVPTWNYAVVHAHGRAQAIHDREWLHQLVTRLTDTHESGRQEPWKVTDAPREYVDRMLEAIVGIEIPLEKMTGKWKVSQNHTPANRQGVAAGLAAQEDEKSQAVGLLVRNSG
jgi:transcriptional regulator